MLTILEIVRFVVMTNTRSPVSFGVVIVMSVSFAASQHTQNTNIIISVSNGSKSVLLDERATVSLPLEVYYAVQGGNTKVLEARLQDEQVARIQNSSSIVLNE